MFRRLHGVLGRGALRSGCVSEVVDLGMKFRRGGLNVGRFGGLMLEGLLVICAALLSFIEHCSDKGHVDMLQDCTSPSADMSQNQEYYLQ